MQRQIIFLIIGSFFILVISCFVLSRGTVGISIERPPTVDQSAIATLAYLELNGTQFALQATQIASSPTATSSLATIQGTICYPSERAPAMILYFYNTVTSQQLKFNILENQSSYSVQLPPGMYYAWSNAPQYRIGGMYSKYVLCGMGENCTDHSPLLFEVRAGKLITGIDICDWAIPIPTEQISPE